MNPVVSRFIAQRPVFSRIPTQTIPDNAASIDPYTMLFGLPDENFDAMTAFLKSMSLHAKNILNARQQLGACYDNLVGTSIMIHCVSEPSLPTYHAHSTHLVEKTEPDEMSLTAYQAKLRWLVDNPFTPPSAPLTYPENVDKAVEPLLRLSSHKYKSSADKDKYIIFDKKVHVTPDQRIFDPYDYSSSKSAFPIVAGLRIESFELDGIEIPLPNLRNSLTADNSQSLQSAISMDQFHAATSTEPVHVIDRSPEDEYEQKASVSFYDMSYNRIARAPLDVMNPDSETLYDESTVPRDWTLLINKFSWRQNVSSRPCPIPEDKIVGWSSYRHLPVYKQWNRITAKDVLALMSFRPQFGTNVTMFQTEHPSRMIPRA
jgi:hypothetical protein